MVNRNNTARKDASQLYMDYIIGDEASIAVAKFGARHDRRIIPAATRAHAALMFPAARM